MRSHWMVRGCLVAVAAVAAALAPAVAGSAEPLAPAQSPAGPDSSSHGPGQTTYRTAAGHWLSARCEPAGGSWLTRDFVLARRSWTLSAAIYADASCSFKLLTFSTVGSYALGDRSRVVPGAREARFAFTVKQVTPFSQAIADVMNTTGCGSGRAQVGLTEDISRTGCPALGLSSVRECPAEYDTLARAGNRLFFGARPADGDLCTRAERPTRLGAPLVLS